MGAGGFAPLVGDAFRPQPGGEPVVCREQGVVAAAGEPEEWEGRGGAGVRKGGVEVGGQAAAAEGADPAEAVRVAQGGLDGLGAAHREPGDGAAGGVGAHGIVRLGERQDFLDEGPVEGGEVLFPRAIEEAAFPAVRQHRHVAVAERHDDHHRFGRAVGDQ